jgi:hypothetical protein
MNTLTLALALLSVSNAPATINHKPGINMLALNGPTTAASDLFNPHADEIPKCLPYCR